MRIHFRNIFVFLLTLVLGVLLLRYGRAVLTALAAIERIGPGHSTDEQVAGVMALGFLGVTLVAIVRLLTANPHDRSGRRQDSDE